MDYYWREEGDQDTQKEEEIINQLSQNLKEKLLIEANKIILKESMIFSQYFSDQII